MVWGNIHDDAPLDDEGRPTHPEKGFTICGYEKTDAVDVNGNKRVDIPYCLQSAGWGTDRSTGHCRNHHGASTGAPEGWDNGNARHLLYSKHMSEDDRDTYNRIVQTADGERIGVDEMAEMLEARIGFEFMRLSRAVDKVPDVELVENYECPECGADWPENATQCQRQDPHGNPKCGYSGAPTVGERFVVFGDKSVERKSDHLMRLIETYHKIAEGDTLHVKGEHDVNHEGGNPVEVNISHHEVALEEDADTEDDEP